MMKLYLLRPKKGLPELPEDRKSNPWEPWYDKAFGFVVRAENETIARTLASKENGEEPADAWTNPELSTCVELTTDGGEGIIIIDFHSA
jgi:hypothetical protein